MPCVKKVTSFNLLNLQEKVICLITDNTALVHHVVISLFI